MTLLPTILQFVSAAAVIVAAGTLLTRFADAIAIISGLGRLLVGSVLLAAATSAPELLVDLNAVRIGAPDLAVGDLAGSSLFNLLILAALDLSPRSRGRMLSRTSVGHALSGTMSIVLTAMTALAILTAGAWTPTLAGVGIGSLAILTVFLLGVRLIFHDQRLSAARLELVESIAGATPSHPSSLLRPVIGFALATAAIVAAAPFMARSADRLAELTGLARSFLGTTLVACCTSLPELVSAIAALRIGALDLAAGNVFGSNCFNMALLVPLDLAHPGSLLASVSSVHVVTCLATIVVTGTAVAAQLYHRDRRTGLVEPDDLLIIVLVMGSLAAVHATTRNTPEKQPNPRSPCTPAPNPFTTSSARPVALACRATSFHLRRNQAPPDSDRTAANGRCRMI